jgi:hypothetical protein
VHGSMREYQTLAHKENRPAYGPVEAAPFQAVKFVAGSARAQTPRSSASSLLTLQRTRGNRHVQRILGLAHLQRQCGCGNQASSGGKCGECAQKQDELNRVVMRQIGPSLQRQNDGGGDYADGGTLDSVPAGPADSGTGGGCNLKIYANEGCVESSLLRTCGVNQCCAAPKNHFAMAQQDSTSSFKGSCASQPLETRRNDPDVPCNWFYKDGGSEFLFATKLDCPVPIA